MSFPLESNGFSQLTGIDDVVALGSRLHTEGDFFFQVRIFFISNAAIVILGPVFQSASVGMKITKELLPSPPDGFRRSSRR